MLLVVRFLCVVNRACTVSMRLEGCLMRLKYPE